MSEDLATKSALVVAHGLFSELAVKLAQSFGKVYLFLPWADAYPTINKGLLGYGLEGVNKVDEVWGPHFASIDLFVFPDLYNPELQLYLEGLGKRVWGGRRGEQLELYREVCKEAMAKVGLPVHPWKLIRGMTALRSHLQAHQNQHVKLDKFRGMFETFKAESYALVEPKLAEIEHLLGPFAEVLEFVVEEDLPDCVEIGLDCYTVDGMFPSRTLAGIEVKDLGYIGILREWQQIPEPLRAWFEKMAPYLERYGYRGFISNELRVTKDKVAYMIDCCARAASPPNELYQEFYTNLAEIVYAGAGGELVDPDPVAKWGVEVMLRSEWAEKHWQPVDFPSRLRPHVKLFNAVRVAGRYSIAPQDEEMTEVGAIIGWGATLEAALEMIDEIAKQVAGYGLVIPTGSLEKAQEQISDLAACGLSVFTEGS